MWLKLARRQNAKNLKVLQPIGNKKTSSINEKYFMRILHSSVLLDCIAVFFLSAGMCAAFLPLTIVDGDIWNWLGVVAISVVLLAVLRVRWWLGPAVVLGYFAVAFIWLYYSQSLAGQYEWLLEFIEWLRQGAPDYEVYAGTNIILAVKCFMIFGTTFGFFLIVRKLFSICLIIAAMGAVLIAAEYAGYYAFSLPIALYVIGLVVLFPRVYEKAIRKQKEKRNASVQLVAVPGAIVVILLAAYFIPQDTSSWYNKKLANFFYDIGYLFNGPIVVYSENRSNFGLEVIGMQQHSERLGGPAQLQSWHMLTVISKQPVLLRGAVMDTYTGQHWTVVGVDGDYRYENVIWGANRTKAFGLDMPQGNAEVQALYEKVTEDLTLEITYEMEHYTTLFAAGQLSELDFSNLQLYPEAFFNLRSELYLTRPVPAKEKITLRTRVLKPFTRTVERDFLTLETLAAAEKDSYYDEVFARYTALPPQLPSTVRETAAIITAGETSAYLKAKNIAEWLGKNCTYTLYPEVLPPERDFVDYFIETGEGYCTYFASAMAVMARCEGIPSRYVTGFALERDFLKADTFKATGKTAHAWTELYFHGIGWVPFDPLYWNANAPLNNIGSEQPYNPADHYYEEEDESYNIYEGLSDWRPAAEEVNTDLTLYWLTGITLIMLAFIGYITYSWNSKYRCYELKAVMRSFGRSTECFSFYYNDIVKQLTLLQMPPRPGETLNNYPSRVDARLNLHNPCFGDVAKFQTQIIFAEAEPSEKELETAYKYHRMLEDLLRAKFSVFTYMRKRALTK